MERTLKSSFKLTLKGGKSSFEFGFRVQSKFWLFKELVILEDPKPGTPPAICYEEKRGWSNFLDLGFLSSLEYYDKGNDLNFKFPFQAVRFYSYVEALNKGGNTPSVFVEQNELKPRKPAFILVDGREGEAAAIIQQIEALKSSVVDDGWIVQHQGQTIPEGCTIFEISCLRKELTNNLNNLKHGKSKAAKAVAIGN